MALKMLFVIGFVAAVLVACGDDDSDFISRPDGKESSSSDVSLSSDSPQSSDGETSVSSSSSAKSSSSSVASSSSSSDGYVEPSTVVVGSMTDERDGQTYKTVTIGTQTWMAENLNYAYTDVPYEYEKVKEVFTSDSTSWCYNDSAEYCAKYGRLYTWAAAMDSVGEWSANGKDCGYGKSCSPTYPVRGICPKGWHLPDLTEWRTLATAVKRFREAECLRSTSGWDGSGNGTDSYSFSALPAGDREYNGNYFGEGVRVDFWSSTENTEYSTYQINVSYIGTAMGMVTYSKYSGFSVRCVKD